MYEENHILWNFYQNLRDLLFSTVSPEDHSSGLYTIFSMKSRVQWYTESGEVPLEEIPNGIFERRQWK